MKKILRSIYLNIPFKKFFFLFLKKNFKIKKNIYKHLWFKGFYFVKYSNISFFIYSLPTIIENEIFWNGLGKTWEPLSIKIWSKISKNKKIIFDIGANTGVYSLLSAAINPRSKIYAFEPNNIFTKAIEKANRKNKFQININNIALSNNNGFVYFDGYQIHKNSNLKKIKTVRLDNFINKNNIKSVDLVKLDVELHEYHVLKGMGKYLQKFKPDFLIEVLNDKIAKKLNNLFKDFGYYYISIDDKKLCLKRIMQIEKSPFYNILICKKETYKLVRHKLKKYFDET